MLNAANKQSIIQLTIERFWQRTCEMIQAEWDADIEIAKAVVTKYVFRFTNLDAEFTDLLLMLLYYAEATNCTDLCFPSDIEKSNIQW